MKTCLYQPIFINPQAYFVFPSLYNIEKGDSFIEPANITGQLIINTLTDDPTLTPIILTVKDTNYVDFSLFKGYHIRISQYTDIGAVVLGEWYIPGTPEPEQPDWFKESIVAWYDPKKQGMTNFDVIESYAEDFTTWRHLDSRGTAAVTPNKITITESFDTTNIVEDVEEPYSDISIYVTGVSEDVPLVVRDITGNKAIITKDGKYDFSKNSRFMGFAINKILSNINVVISLLPTSILKDFSGNGNHAYLYGGKGKLNSGMGVYQQDFSKLIISRVDKKQDPFSFTVSGSGGSYLAYMQLGNWNNKAFKILVNINAERDYLYLRFRNNTDAVITSVALKNGENIIPAQNIEGATKAVFEYSLKEGETITITQIPDYPDQLCYDGMMYAVCYGFPILTDYTVMAERTWFEIGSNSCFASKRLVRDGFDNIAGAFAIEYRQKYCNNFGAATAISFEANKQEVIVQTKAKYMSTNINVGDGDDSDILIIGANNNRADAPREPYKGCHSDFLLFNRTLTQEEIDWIKENIYNIEI